jgi:hypothetical protein
MAKLNLSSIFSFTQNQGLENIMKKVVEGKQHNPLTLQYHRE